MVDIAIAIPANEPNSNCGCTAKSEEQPSSPSKGKLIKYNDIMKGFETGQERVKVIVNLAEPVETKARTNWHSKHSLKLLQNEIKTIQTPVLSALSEGEFKLRYRFDNQAGFSGEVTQQGLEKLKNDPRVISVEPVYLLEPHLRQGIPLMHADTYRSSYNGTGVAIAICDTGIDYRHSMLGNGGFPNSKVLGGYDYGDYDADPIPDNTQAHGTCCAGIAAGDLGDVGDYIGGVAYNAKLYALKITAGSSGSASSDAMVAAWNWCVTHQNDNPAHPILVISTSFGGGRNYSTCDSYIPSMTLAANNAVAAGITILVSSGNDGYCDSIAWPACISSVISVGAVYDAAFGTYLPCVNAASCATKYSTTGCTTGWYAIDTAAADMVTSYSNTASFLTVLAPSNQCYTTDIISSGGYSSGDYDSTFGGTSAACPYAAGAVACLQSAAKSITGSFLSVSDVKTILTSTGNNITDGKVAITKPRINLEQAINNLLIESPPIAQNGSASTQINTSVPITLVATDDGLPNPPGVLSYIITSLPTNGSLSDPCAGGIIAVPYTLAANGNQVIYTPATDYTGPDSLQFKANDGGVPSNGGDSNIATISIMVSPRRSTIFSEDFESGLGSFTIDNTFGDGSGLWHLTTICNSILSSHSTPTSLYYGQNSTCNYDAGQTEGIATSSVISLAGASMILLEFNYMLETERFSGYDIASIEVSENGGDFIEYLSNTLGTLLDSSGGWVPKTLDLSSMAGSNVQIRFRFRTVDNMYNTYPGFYVDDVKITGEVLLPFIISGYIKNECNVPINGVLVDANNGGQDTTDANGFYEVMVDYNWSGTVTPSKINYTFDPNSKAYTNVLENKTGQDYLADNIYDLNCDDFISYGDVAIMCENWLVSGPDVPGDIRNDDGNIVNFLDFAKFAEVW